MINFDELKEQAVQDLKIDTLNLDSESLATPSLYVKWLNFYTIELTELNYLDRIRKKLRFTMTKYYSGKAHSDVYVQKPLHEVYLKSEIDKVIDASNEWIGFKEKYDNQKIKVDYIEMTMKQISNRGFAIKAAIEWRRFQNGQ
jgi:hypothetical protein